MISYTGAKYATGPLDLADFITWGTTGGAFTLDPRAAVTFDNIYTIYKVYAGDAAAGPNKFSTALTRLGSPSIKGTNGRRYKGGIRLNQP